MSIVSRGSAFGRSPWSSSDDREVLTKRELMAQLIVLLGGRAAEMDTFGQPSTRSEDDLEHAAALARRMVERLAMTGRFDLADKGAKDEDGDGAKEVRELLLRAEQAARTILGDNAEDLRRIAEALTEKETLSSAEISMLTTTRKRGPLLPAGQATPGGHLSPDLSNLPGASLRSGGRKHQEEDSGPSAPPACGRRHRPPRKGSSRKSSLPSPPAM